MWGFFENFCLYIVYVEINNSFCLYMLIFQYFFFLDVYFLSLEQKLLCFFMLSFCNMYFFVLFLVNLFLVVLCYRVFLRDLNIFM